MLSIPNIRVISTSIKKRWQEAPTSGWLVQALKKITVESTNIRVISTSIKKTE